MSDIAADQLSITQHQVTIAGATISYQAVAGTLILKEETEKQDGSRANEGEQAKAALFFVAYVRDDLPEHELAQRPLTFSFNGGPGSSSVWMHMGLLGPRRVLMGDVGELAPPPWQWAENPYSLLDESDLVFIDPVGTGFSRGDRRRGQ